MYSDKIDEKLSEIPWISNVYVFMLKDENNNYLLEKNDKLKTIYWIEPTYELEKSIYVRTIADILEYRIEIKVNNSELNDEIKINRELDKILTEDFITVPADN